MYHHFLFLHLTEPGRISNLTVRTGERIGSRLCDGLSVPVPSQELPPGKRSCRNGYLFSGQIISPACELSAVCRFTAHHHSSFFLFFESCFIRAGLLHLYLIFCGLCHQAVLVIPAQEFIAIVRYGLQYCRLSGQVLPGSLRSASR